MAGRNWLESLKKKGREQAGQALAEYALIITFIAIVAIGALTLLGTSIQGIITDFAGNF